MKPPVTAAVGPANNKSIAQIVSDLGQTMTHAIDEINDINSDTQLLSLNARIEAARAGSMGAAFGVVAQEMQALSTKTTQVANQLAERSRSSIDGLLDLIGSNVRGTRLSDLALTNIDLIDRNLYERTCDVRWWATDSSLVDALTRQTHDMLQYASQRMSVILNAYTVYHDLVLCDTSGKVVANGRPAMYPSVGQSVASEDWFQQANRSKSGDEFGFSSAQRSPLVNGQSVLTYSCGVREGGRANGRLLGVLGVLFNWETFAQTIVQQVPIDDDDRAATRVCICDSSLRILADSWGKQLDETLRVPQASEAMALRKGYLVAKDAAKSVCIAHALAPGFETYSTGWHSFIVQGVR